ncbi:hypothetical protein I3F58_14465 [Streptomyces sp. MUM 203J]|uniref:hypothetical protein n=1 Tax=Streptomyces sp. MUM 203J TaxID=2791990 RepID=UPI001F0339AF|nr:hypothetical protein [Streptomyces sp. MUM 203J]MCH0540750.1 hypothetical protein [Streptomyces sp. MUM 203J]
MTDPICRIAEWLRLVFAPGSGRRRAGARPTTAAPTAQPQSPRTSYGRVAQFGPGWGWTARPRPPYGLRGTFDGDTLVLVRPYLVAHEERQERARQRRRCLALVMAADFGIDLDRRVLHGVSR